MIRKILVIILVLVSLLFSIPEIRGEKKVFITKKKIKLYAGRKILHMKNELYISREQEKKIRSVIYDMEDYFMKKRAEIKVMELKLSLFIKQNSDKRRDIEKKVRDIYDLKSQLLISMFNHMLNLYDILTPEQKKRLEALDLN